MEHHVTDLNLSKQLKEAGVPQKSQFYWRKYSLCKEPALYWELNSKIDLAVIFGKLEYKYSAFLASELGEMLPAFIYTEEGTYDLMLEIIHVGTEWEANYCWTQDVDNGGFHNLPGVSDEMLCGCLAKRLLYLIKHNLINFKKEK
jgi:hypothetical protein